MVRNASLALFLIVVGCQEPPPPDPVGARPATANETRDVAYYEMATEVRPDDADAWTGLAREQLRAGDAIGATLAARRAVALAADSADAQELLGLSLLAAASGGEEASATPSDNEVAPPGTARSIGRAAEAAVALTRALELAPERGRIHFPLGRAHERAVQPEEASAAYRASAEAGVLPARSRVAAVRTQIDALGSEELTEEMATELRAELDTADELAPDDAAARGAVAAQRRRIEQKLERQARRFDLAAPMRAADRPPFMAADPEAIVEMLREQRERQNLELRGVLSTGSPEDYERMLLEGEPRPNSGAGGGGTVGALVQP